MFTYFRLISSKLEPEGTRGNDEDAEIIISSSSNIYYGWSTIADIGFVGWQSIINWLAASANRWRIGANVLSKVIVKRCA